MHNNNGVYPTAATSSATLNSILTTTASPLITQHQQHLPTIPAKRKIRDVSPTMSYDPYSPASTSLHQAILSPSPFPYAAIPAANSSAPRNNRRNSHTNSNHSSTPIPEHKDVSSEAIDCICGFAIDDGFSIACDICSRWCHSACFGIARGGPVPDDFECWVCCPRSSEVKERAVQLQRARLGGAFLGVSNSGGESGLGLSIDDDAGKRGRRMSSPGTDRRARRGNTAAVVEGNGPPKRRRRPSVIHPPPTPTIPTSSTSFHQPPPTSSIQQSNDDEHVDIDAEPWTSTYVSITHDIVPDDHTRTKLRRHAQRWRGITAVSPCPPSPPPIAIRPLPPSSSPLLSSANTQCLPPSYAAYTTRPLPSSSLITPYLSCITPSSAYLREPTNGYAHLGMPKPYVHLVGPPLGVALDARGVGGEGRFVRWGCRPNAVLRPVLCKEGRENMQKAGVRYEKGKQKQKDRDGDETESESDPEEDETTLGFAVFALRDLKAGEEVVLGWEWDDGHAVHRLPALFRAPNMFPPVPLGPASPAELTHLRNQLSSILHALSSTFTTCACGARARDCALSAMASVVERLEGPGALPFSFPENDPRTWAWADEGRQERSGVGTWADVDLGPLVGRKRGFRTRERVPYSGGMGGMEMVEDGEGATEARRRDGSGIGSGSGGLKRNGPRVNGRRVLAGKYALKTGTENEKASDFTFSVVAPNGAAEAADATYRRQDRKGKGKAREVDDEDVEMDCVDGRSEEPDCAGSTLLHPDSASMSTSRPPPVPSSHTQPNLEPRPPDPPPALQDEDRMPPKMRKRWMHRELRLLSEQLPQLAPSEVQEKEFDGWAVDACRGLAIRFDDQPTNTTGVLSAKLASDELTYPNNYDLMPPPPMPAALDPTTISSQHVHSTTPTPSPPSPHLPTPSPTNLSLSPRTHGPDIVHVDGDMMHHKHPHLKSHIPTGLDAHSTGISPLTGFANLSLMSPALIADKDNGQSLGLASETPIPFPSSLPPREDAGNRTERDQGVEDVEMGVVETAHGDEQTEERVEEENGAELSSPWSPLRRAVRTVEDSELPEPEVEAEAEVEMVQNVAPEAQPALHVLDEPAIVKFSPSLLDSMASTPVTRVSPAPFPAAPIPDSRTSTLDAIQAEAFVEIQVEEVEDAPPSPKLAIHSEAQSADISASRDPSLRSPIQATNAAHISVAPSSLPTPIPPPPDHFFDTDDEEEWKRQMQMDIDKPSVTRSLSPQSSYDADSVVEEEDEEQAPQQTFMVHRTPTPQLPSESEDELDESRQRLPTPRKRQTSIDSSRSVSMARTASEPPPPTGTTIDESDAPPPSAALILSIDIAPSTSLPPPKGTTMPTSDAIPVPLPTKSVLASPSDSAPSSGAHDHQPSPAPDTPAPDHAAQPKVKLSLRDFVLRKKKQREEQEATKSTQASPMSVTSALAVEEGDGERGGTPVPAVGSMPKSLPGTDAKEVAIDLSSATTTVELEPAPAPSPVVRASTPSASGIDKEDSGDRALLQSNKQDTPPNPSDRSKDAWWLPRISKPDAVDPKVSQLSNSHPIDEKPRLSVAIQLLDTSKTNDKSPENILSASTSFPAMNIAPLAQPVGHDPILNRFHPLPTKVSSLPSLPLLPKVPFPLPSRPQQSPYMPPSHRIDTREAKTELLDPHSTFPGRSMSPISPDLGLFDHPRRPSHEDGEIGEASPPIASYRPLASSVRPFPSKGRPFPTNITNPQSHSPPTGPRSSFYPPSGSPTSFNGSASSYRSLPPPQSASVTTNAAANRPPPPSAPRALRQSMLSNKPLGASASNVSSSPSYSHGGPPYIPRGPSADRDRDRDRDWDARHYRGPRRGGGGGWSR